MGEKPEEKKQEAPVEQPEIVLQPTAFAYVVKVDGQPVQTDNVETALTLNLLNKINEKLDKLLADKK